MFQPAGSQSYYSNAVYEVFSRVLTRIAGKRLDEVFRERIGDRIGITDWSWNDWQGTVNEAPDGIVINRGSHGVMISAQSAARMGHLFLNEGRWNDEQIISSEWVHNATSPQVDVSLPLNPRNRTQIVFGINGGPGIYGYGWWANGQNPEGNRLLPGVPPETFFAYGIDNNFIFVMPEWDMVVVREASREGDRSVANNIWATFLNLVGDAVMDVSGGDSLRAADEFTRLPYAIYQTRDDGLDGKGDRTENLVSRRADPFKSFVGEVDSANTAPSMSRIVAKYALPNMSKSGARVQLEEATLRLFLDSVVGNVTDPVAVLHSITDNDTEVSASDHEDVSYTDTSLNVLQPTDIAGQYYSVDVTPFVQLDYEADGSDALSAFRFELRNHVVVTDQQGARYDVVIAGNRAHYPELVLRFGLVGDLNHDSTLDVADIELLNTALRRGDTDLGFDLNDDGFVDKRDQTEWVHELKQTWYGDANLDGEFNSSDLVNVFQAGQYEDAIEDNSGWASGDWDADGDFTTGDLVLAFQDGGYEQGPRSSVAAVPEPATSFIALISLLATSMWRRRK